MIRRLLERWRSRDAITPLDIQIAPAPPQIDEQFRREFTPGLIVSANMQVTFCCPCGVKETLWLPSLDSVVQCHHCHRMLTVRGMHYARENVMCQGVLAVQIGWFYDSHKLGQMDVSATLQ